MLSNTVLKTIYSSSNDSTCNWFWKYYSSGMTAASYGLTVADIIVFAKAHNW